jgi:UPF0755 protein
MAIRKFIKRTAVLLMVLAVLAGLTGWMLLFNNNINTPNTAKEIYVPDTWDYDSLYDHLIVHVLKEPMSFDFLAKKMNLPKHIYKGKYTIKEAMGNRELIQFFRSGQTEDVKVMIKAGMQLSDVAGALSNELAVDSLSMLKELMSGDYINGLDFTKNQKLCLFVANTYSFNWATNPEDLVKRFEQEYKKFWDNTKFQRAKGLSLSPIEVGILASIVDGEVIYSSEMKNIAGVYLNRLRQRWPLGADPTLMFMVRQEGRRRVLNSDLKRDHPYNTYRIQGLPPGPIGLPSGKAIEAVLDAEKHNYMYFCAEADLSGYHHFSVTLREHNRYANAYHRAMDRRGIMR